MNCPKCNKEVSPEWELCPHCKYTPKKCSNPDCKSGWLPQDAKFCPECGGPLKGGVSDEIDETTSIMKLYPKLRLVPASWVRRSGLFGWWVLYIFVLLVLAYFFAACIVGICDDINELWIPLLVLSVGLILWGNLFHKKMLRHPRGGYKKLITEADYVSGNRGLCIFVKNKRFGLIKLWNYTVFVPPIYDYMEWETRNKYLRVKKEGRAFLIDIYNNEV